MKFRIEIYRYANENDKSSTDYKGGTWELDKIADIPLSLIATGINLIKSRAMREGMSFRVTNLRGRILAKIKYNHNGGGASRALFVKFFDFDLQQLYKRQIERSKVRKARAIRQASNSLYNL